MRIRIRKLTSPLCFNLIVIALLLHGCGNDSGSEEKVSGVGAFVGSGTDQQQQSSNSAANSGTKPFPHLDPVYPSMQNLQGHPQQFPSYYPVNAYPGSKVALVRIEAKQAPGVMNQVMLSAGDTPYQVDAFYASKLTKDGWTKIREFENQAFGTSTWQKDGQQVEVRVSPDPHGAQNIQLFWGMAPRTPKVATAAAGSTAVAKPAPVRVPVQPTGPDTDD